MRKSFVITIFLIVMGTQAFAQLVVTPIQHSSPPKKIKSISARSLTPMLLPFWDDFSITSIYPNDTLWERSSVSLNYGIGINPPSLGSVTFDGLDSLGKPFDVNNSLAKGYADYLVSRPIRLDLVPAGLRNTVYFSFFYQYKGNGEAPDLGDHLDLEFKDAQGNWVPAFAVDTEDPLPDDEFTQAIIAVSGDDYFHASFQFRFRSFGRLSGPYDTWNVDYVYLNSGRSPTDTSYPDRTIASTMTSPFKDYWAIPKKHFLLDPSANLGHPSFSLYNLLAGNVQPMNYAFHADLVSYNGATPSTQSIILQDSTSIGNSLLGLERRTITTDSTFSPSVFDPAADSFKIKLLISVNTKDNLPPSESGDYIAAKYAPIDFRVSDTTRAEATLAKYYAYDDGTAEYGIGLNQPGAQVAYRFDMVTPTIDTVVAIDIHFPRFGDESSQIILLQILTDLTGNLQSMLYEENIVVKRSEQNQFVRYQLTRNTVLVQQTFYVGWKQSAAVNIPIGWDKNTDSGDKIFFNTNGSWEPNLIEHGSMMIRPVFGKGGVVTGLPRETRVLDIYPNPSSGTFFVRGEPHNIALLDLAGQAIPFSSEVIDHDTRIEMRYAVPGIYVLKVIDQQGLTTQKVMVRD